MKSKDLKYRYALVNGEKQEAMPGLRGICIGCGVELIARCGEQNRWHWAHKNNKECPYSKKEPKTQWHLDWQNNFPKEWQEVRCTDEQTGEIHIADIKTPRGLVIEFQHSYIDSEERKSREDFHNNMIWVIDGARCKTHFERFSQNLSKSIKTPKNKRTDVNLCAVIHLDKLLPKNWQSLTVPVYVDFYSEEDKTNSLRNYIWGFYKNQGFTFLTWMSRDNFVDLIKKWEPVKINNSSTQTSLYKTVYPKYLLNQRTKVIQAQNWSTQQIKNINKSKGLRF